MSAITCRDLTKTYGKTDALHQLSCTIAADAITGIVGPNGAGKTTLLKCIAGHYYPTSGTIRVYDRDPYDDLTLAASLIFVDETMTFPGRSAARTDLRSLSPFLCELGSDAGRKIAGVLRPAC